MASERRTIEKREKENKKMAQGRGFEPRHRVTDLLAFQASPFSHLGIPATPI